MSLNPNVLECFDAEVRKEKEILAPDYRQEFDGQVRRTVGRFASASHNWIDYFELAATEIGEAIAKQVAHFESIGHSFRWKIYSHDQPVQLSKALLDRGFRPCEPCTLMILDVVGFQARLPDGIEFRRVSDPDALPDELRPIKETVWDEGADELMSALRAEMRAEMRDMGDHMRIHVAKRGSETVGCGLIRFNERKTFGGLFAGATVPAERGKGVYRGLVATRVEDARQSKTDYLYVEAGSMSRPILKRLGFATVATVTNYAFEVS